MDYAGLASFVLALGAFVFAYVARGRSRRAEDRKADTGEFVAVTAGQGALIKVLQDELRILRDEVRRCEEDKARMKGRYDAEIEALRREMRGGS